MSLFWNSSTNFYVFNSFSDWELNSQIKGLEVASMTIIRSLRKGERTDWLVVSIRKSILSLSKRRFDVRTSRCCISLQLKPGLASNARAKIAAAIGADADVPFSLNTNHWNGKHAPINARIQCFSSGCQLSIHASSYRLLYKAGQGRAREWAGFIGSPKRSIECERWWSQKWT